MHFFLAQAYRESGRLQDAAAEMKISARSEQKRADTAKRAEDVLHAKEPPQ